MDKLYILVTRVTGLMEQNRFVADRRADSYRVFFFAKLVLFCAFVMFFFITNKRFICRLFVGVFRPA